MFSFVAQITEYLPIAIVILVLILSNPCIHVLNATASVYLLGQ